IAMTAKKYHGTPLDQGPLPLEDRVALGLGRILMQFAALEGITRMILDKLLEALSEDHRAAIASTLSFRRLRELTLVLFRTENGEGQGTEDLRELMNRAASAEHRRNVLVHSLWSYAQLPG